ncbi:tetratricopeptide repeat protein [Candidatus Latescibacterota bacterium]
MKADLNRTTLVVGAFLILHLLLAHWRPLSMWGGDHLAYHGGWSQLLFIISSAVLVVSPLRQRLIDGIVGLAPDFDPWGTPRERYLSAVLLVSSGSIAFVSLSSATHLLGDGYLYLREMGESIWQTAPRTDRAPLAFWLIRTLHQLGEPFGSSAETTYRTYSYISGVLYLLLSLPLARILGRSRLERMTVLAFLLTPGFLPLFFGYVENYSMLFPGILLYLLVALQTLRRRLPLWVAAGLLGVLIPLHLALVTLAPSLLALAIQKTDWRMVSGSSGPARWKAPLSNLACLTATPIAVVVILMLIDCHPLTYMEGTGGPFLLPVFGGPDFTRPYGIFSSSHLLDVFNQYLLVAPAALIVLLLLRRDGRPRDLDRTFLLTATLFPVLFSLVANPAIGAFRDWDVLAFAALPFTLWAAVALIRQSRDGASLFHAGPLVCGAAALHTLVWIGLNASTASAEARFVDVLERSQLSPYARSYAWETLGGYYGIRNEPERAFDAYRRALDADPGNPRRWNAVGARYCDSGRPQTAIEHLETAIALRPSYAEAYFNMGKAYACLGEHHRAITHYEKAIALRPDYPEAYSSAGMAHYRLGNHGTAIERLQRAITLRPDYAEAHCHLGNVHQSLGRPEAASDHYQRAIAIRPDLVEAHCNLGKVNLDLRKYQSAIDHYQKAVAGDPALVDAYFGMGNAYYSLQDFQRAVDHYQKDIALRPDHAEAYSNAGIAYYRLNQYETAIEYLQRAVALKPDYAEAYANLGRALYGLGQVERARDCLEKALELDPDSAQSSALRERMRTSGKQAQE